MKRLLGEPGGFTLVEIIVVLAIILIIVGILTPTFRSAQEKANQGTCLSKLHQIAVAVKQYRIDEGAFPASLIDISDYMSLSVLGGKATGGKSQLLCPDDSNTRDHAFTDNNLPYSSYYDTSTTDLVWNYWGYQPTGFAYATDTPDFYTAMTSAGITNPKHYTRLANPFAPDYTIITHCVWHRNKTGKNENQQVDTVVRVGGSAKALPFKSYDWLRQPD